MRAWIVRSLVASAFLLLSATPGTAHTSRPFEVGVHAQANTQTACFSCEPAVVPPPHGERVEGVGGLATARSGFLFDGGGSPPSGGGEGASAGARAVVDELAGFMSVRTAGSASGIANGHATATALIDDTITLSAAATVVLEGSIVGSAAASFDRDATVGARLFFHGPFTAEPTEECGCEGGHFPQLGGFRSDWGGGENRSETFSVSVDLPAGTSSFNARLNGFADAVGDRDTSDSASASAQLSFRIVLPGGVSAFSSSGLLPIAGGVAPPNTPVGENVSVALPHGVSLRFDAVTAAGNSSVVRSETGPPLSASFSLADPPTHYDISTSAAFAGQILVCIDTTGITFTGPPALLHFENDDWVDVTVNPVVLPTLCGNVSSLSPFALASASNTAPTAPGAPQASLNPNAGFFNLSWTASSDAEGDPLEYFVEHRVASETVYGLFINTLNLVSVDFGAPFRPVTEGTWVYRVRSIDFGSGERLWSDYSDESEPVKIDLSAPNPPRLAADRSAEHDGWYRDTVTVSFASDGDPLLFDRSAGTGVDPASVPSPVTRSVSGSQVVRGTVRDLVGNESAPGELAIRVDADVPEVSMTCPDSVTLGSASSGAWQASDAHSGLTSPSGGSIALDTSTVGTRTATSPVARDNVGHEASASCTYRVLFDFAGFFRPVGNLPTLNSVNAGRAVPVKFSLGGNQGLAVFATGYPRSEAIACDSSAPVDGVEETVTAGASSFSYDAEANHYVYVWKTDRAWAGTCRQLVVKLVDGTYHRANFQFE